MATLPRSLRSRGSVKDVRRHCVKDVMELNTSVGKCGAVRNLTRSSVLLKTNSPTLAPPAAPQMWPPSFCVIWREQAFPTYPKLSPRRGRRRRLPAQNHLDPAHDRAPRHRHSRNLLVSSVTQIRQLQERTHVPELPGSRPCPTARTDRCCSAPPRPPGCASRILPGSLAIHCIEALFTAIIEQVPAQQPVQRLLRAGQRGVG